MGHNRGMLGLLNKPTLIYIENDLIMKRATAKDKSQSIRFPKGLLKQIDASAKKNSRSRNSEVIVRLETSFSEKQEQEQK